MKTDRGERLNAEARYISDYSPEILNGGLFILDMGSGPGEFMELCNSYGNQSMGIDYKVYDGSDCDKLLIIKKDLRELFKHKSWPAPAFDFINCKHALGNLMKKHVIVAEDYKYNKWTYSDEMAHDFYLMFRFVYCGLKPDGLFLIAAHHCLDEDIYSDYIIRQAVKSGFKLENKYSNLIHKFRKI